MKRKFGSKEKFIATADQIKDAVTSKSVSKSLQDLNDKIDSGVVIKSAHGEVLNTGGDPSVDVIMEDGNINFTFDNIKGENGKDGATGATGPQGPQGDSFQPIEDVSGLVLAHTTGQDNTKAMSQKGVTDAISATQDEIVVNISDYLTGTRIHTTNDIIDTSSGHVLFYMPVTVGDNIHITATNSEAKVFRYGFTTVVPASGVAVQGAVRLTTTSVNESVIAPVNGYFVIHHSNDMFADMKVTVKKSASANDINEKASKNTLLDVLDMCDGSLVSIAETATHSNSVNIYGHLVNSMQPSTPYQTYEYAVEEEKIYIVSSRLFGGTTDKPEYVFLDSSNRVLSYGRCAGAQSENYSARVISPKDAVKLYVNGTPNSHGLFCMSIPHKTIYPKMIYEHLSNYDNRSGIFGMVNKYFKAVSTVRFIKVNGNFTITLPQNLKLRLVEYDSDFQCITWTSYDVTANTETELSVLSSTSYIKIEVATNFSNDFADAEDIDIPVMKLKGNFPENWDVHNISQVGTNPQLVTAWVQITDPTCCDDNSNDVQDTGEWAVDNGLTTVHGGFLWDYGRIYLPATYKNLGEPTRLIIYCHGAAVNYDPTPEDDSQDQYISVDIEPTYWLKEGYAVMDMEGNPFNNTDEHFFSPQAMECYTAGYKWAIEHYNLKRDGVLLGGRSMGGGMTFNMLREQCPIPVIAACADVPSGTPTFYWNFCNKARREFLAKALGFTESLPTSWSGTSPMPTAEWDCLKANWDKLVKYSLMWPLVTDLPSKETLMDSSLNISNSITSPDAENAVYGNLHMKVKAPVKIFSVKLDGVCPWQRTGQLYYKMLMNSGQIAEFRVYEGNSSLTGTENHHADTQDPNLRCDVTTKYGEELTDIPVVYIEMLKFWRRFEQ